VMMGGKDLMSFGSGTSILIRQRAFADMMGITARGTEGGFEYGVMLRSSTEGMTGGSDETHDRHYCNILLA
jgi:hypothetical protein